MDHSLPPVVTLTTDFGLDDFYVAAMKGAVLRHCPAATLVDVTHAVPRHDVLFGSIMLERALAAFSPGTIHVVVVDPGVGTDRRLLLTRWPDGQIAICPDNGLITWALCRRDKPEIFELSWRPSEMSCVFHGRDVMAPTAGMLAAGREMFELIRSAENPILLEIAPARAISDGGAILHIDHFGNAMTNVPEELFSAAACDVRIRGHTVGSLRRTYSDVAPGAPLALIGSSGLLEIAVREGSAHDLLGLRVGDRVEVIAE
jgi:S-adenosylmethionine hydrolase